MSKTGSNFDVFDDTFDHAAIISLNSSERVLGPDKEFWQGSDEETELNEIVCQYSESQGSNNSAKPLLLTKSFNEYDDLNALILLRDAEITRHTYIRKDLIDRYTKVKRRSLEIKSITVQSSYCTAKRRSYNQIVCEAEKLALKDKQETENELQLQRANMQRQLQFISFQGVCQYQIKFRRKYDQVVQLLLSIDKQTLNSFQTQNLKLRDIVQVFDKFITKIKNGDCDVSLLKDMEALYKSLEEVELSIIQSLEITFKEIQRKTEAIAEAELIKKQNSDALKSKEISTVPDSSTKFETFTTALPNKECPTSPTITDVAQPKNENSSELSNGNLIVTKSSIFASTDCFRFYTQVNELYQEKVEKVKPLQLNEQFKKFRFACQKAINTPVNAISSVTAEHLQDKFDKLYSFITGQPVQTGEGYITVNDHPLGLEYCILLMAKKFVSQGDTSISSNPQAAFPVASVIISLWKIIPDFGTLFLAYVFKESPFLVPRFPLKRNDQSVEDWYKLLGYHSKNGQLEPQDIYLKRQAGITRLYIAVMLTNGRYRDGTAHPYSLEHGWRLLTNFVLLNPLPDISATIILETLQIIGSELWAAYGKQFEKLLIYIQQQYFPKLAAIDEGGPKARLEILLAKSIREREIPKVSGLLPVGFW